MIGSAIGRVRKGPSTVDDCLFDPEVGWAEEGIGSVLIKALYLLSG